MTDIETRARALPRFLPTVAWISFILNVAIIATGGAVRLTGSGLGCSEWPLCTPESLVPTHELGIHGIIEFGNRTISGPLLLAAILVVIFGWRVRHARRAMFVLAWIVLGLVITQAVVGGVLVWEELAAALVGFHYVVSLIIVCLTAAYLVLLHESAPPTRTVPISDLTAGQMAAVQSATVRTAIVAQSRVRAVPRGFAILTHATTLVLAITVLAGVFTTAAGPHSGDDGVVRNGFDATVLAHVHAWPGYALLALTLALFTWATVSRLQPLPWVAALLIAQVVQIAIGIYQSRNGLPPLAVGIHMVLAALTAAAMTVVVLRLKRRSSTPGD